MSFCSFSKDFSKNSITCVQNSFITDYLTDASGDSVKVYLYGLYLCGNSAEESSISEFSKNLYMEEDYVKDCFLFWEEYGIVSIISSDPFTVKYLTLSKSGKPRKYKAEKYTEFNKAIQTLITERMISTNEYSEYFSIMEDYSIKPEAMLMILKYCVDLKGANIGYRYITTVAKDFAARQITTEELIEQELSDYINRTNDIQKILDGLKIKRKPDIDDLKMLNKWRQDFQFELENILFVIKTIKARSIDKLDSFMLELFNNKRFSKKEIEGYLIDKNTIKDIAVKTANALSIYCEVITPYIDSYVSAWINKGFDGDTILFIANYCFKKNRRTFEDVDETVENCYSQGIVTLESIVSYIKNLAAEDEFIKELLKQAQSDRKPNKWDRENLLHWREWGFTDEMLTEAAKLSTGKNSPVSYMNVILSTWKSKSIFSPEQIPLSAQSKTQQSASPLFGTERNYTKEDYQAMFQNFDDVEL